MREMHCVCGARPTAENDEELVRKVLEHALEVHPEMELTEEQARARWPPRAPPTNRPSTAWGALAAGGRAYPASRLVHGP